MYHNFIKSHFGIWRVVSNGESLDSIKLIGQSDVSDSNPDKITDQAVKELNEYFSGQRTVFEVPLNLNQGSMFFQQVWKAVANVPYGSTKSYAQIASEIGHSKAVRAVGLANGKNPLPIIIPCHRIIGSSGKLTGYAYGLKLKQSLLMLEKPQEYGIQRGLFS